MTLKAAPKTFNQVRNFLYLSAAMAGFVGGRKEKLANDALWSEHQKKQWQEAYTKKEEAHRASHPPAPAAVPAGVPAELSDLYKALNQ